MSVSGVNYADYGNPATQAASKTTSSSTPSTSDSGAPSFPSLLGGQPVSGGVTATLPDGITIGIWELAPDGSTLSGASTGGSDTGSSADGASASGGSASQPDFAYMTSALEQMVEQFMASGLGASATAAAGQAYGAQPADPTQTSNANAASALV